ncbi:hypothetical protein ACFLTO_03925 [Chloroflexota bacterium]
MGVILGLITRICSKRYLFKADTFVEKQAVKDYNGFLRAIPFNSNTIEVIRGIIADEEAHIINWQKAVESLVKKPEVSVQ